MSIILIRHGETLLNLAKYGAANSHAVAEALLAESVDWD
jgi:broad specificity phosphatase PhoE